VITRVQVAVESLIETHSLAEVLRAVAWYAEAHRAVPVRAAPSAPTVPVSPLSEYTPAEEEQIERAKRTCPDRRVYGPKEAP
jgi:hypothetical protein